MIIRPYPNFEEGINNPGDLISEIGFRNMAKEILDSDSIFLVGTPWIWYTCHESDKYRWLETQLDLYSGKKFIGVGIGACAPLGETFEFISRDKGTAESCKRIWSKFHKIITRDEEAQNFFNHIGVESILFRCPSVFAYEDNVQPDPGSKIIVDSEPWHEGFRLAKIPDLNGDTRIFKYSSGVYSEKRVNELLRFLALHETIISARVHCALPMSPHRSTSIIPCDMRWKTAKQASIKVWPEVGEPIGKPDKTPYLNYMDL